MHFGYKDYATTDNAHKLIREYDITSAEVHDYQIFEDILTENASKDVWADSAYQSEVHAVRFHYRLVFIHDFPNGNGHHARIMADALCHIREGFESPAH
ncbi:MAG: hypothetical protein DSZ28_00235 [Thiothrix sp.]|nr:MAG: hypothetical protein DSZ28_00235 [Thiothrix sp.]